MEYTARQDLGLTSRHVTFTKAGLLLDRKATQVRSCTINTTDSGFTAHFNLISNYLVGFSP